MRISEVRHGYQLAAERGHMPRDLVNRATVATILEAASAAFHKSYYGLPAAGGQKGGRSLWSEGMDAARAVTQDAREHALKAMDYLITDIEPVYRRLGATMVTTDFPLALAQVRDRVRRESYNPIESRIFDVATRRTATDFKRLRGIRTDPFDRLKLRPEGTSVEYAKIGSSEDGYAVANYELAIPLTWEAWINDDIGEFVTSMSNLGIAARRTRGLVTFEAIRDGTTRLTPSGSNPEGSPGAGGPTPANVVWAYQTLAEQTNADSKPMPRMLTDIAIPAKWTITARHTLRSEQAAASSTRAGLANAAFGLANLLVEPMMGEVMGASGGSDKATDWVAFDASQSWLEFAALAGYEAGPRTFTKLPDVLETINEGSFDTHAIAVKVSDNIGAKVVDSKSVLRIAGE